jgi:predicted RNA binding protein YcfA (HicA-like mRNA interferase family)
MKNLLEDSCEPYSYVFSKKNKKNTDIEKANKYHDRAGRFTSADNAVAPKGKKPKLKRGGAGKKSDNAKAIAEAEDSLKKAGITLKVIKMPKTPKEQKQLAEKLEKQFFAGSSKISEKLFPDGFQDQWFVSAHNLIQSSLRVYDDSYLQTEPENAKTREKVVVVAEIKGKIVGALRWNGADNEIRFAGSFRVARGTGSAMFGQAVRLAASQKKPMKLDSLIMAMPFWEKMGFRATRQEGSHEREMQVERDGTVTMQLSREDVAKLARELP